MEPNLCIHKNRKIAVCAVPHLDILRPGAKKKLVPREGPTHGKYGRWNLINFLDFKQNNICFTIMCVFFFLNIV